VSPAETTKTAKTAIEVEDNPRLTPDRWLGAAIARFDVQPEILKAAFASKGKDTDLYTADQVRETLDEFLNAPVKREEV
jgi:hypothetical protein